MQRKNVFYNGLEGCSYSRNINYRQQYKGNLTIEIQNIDSDTKENLQQKYKLQIAIQMKPYNRNINYRQQHKGNLTKEI